MHYFAWTWQHYKPLLYCIYKNPYYIVNLYAYAPVGNTVLGFQRTIQLFWKRTTKIDMAGETSEYKLHYMFIHHCTYTSFITQIPDYYYNVVMCM